MEEINGIHVLDHIPTGWRVIADANMAPRGYRFIRNNKSRWSGEYEHALVPDEVAIAKIATSCEPLRISEQLQRN